MRTYSYLPIILLAITLSCISPLDIKTEQEDKILVVEGYISTLPGPYTIVITKSARYGTIFDGIEKRESGAKVWIKDNDGNTTFLIDEQYGIYRTPAEFRGEVGKSYVLNITTAIGDQYASIPETIQPVPKIDSLYFVYKTQPYIETYDSISGVEVYAVWQDPPDETNFYFWKTCWISGSLSGIYDADYNFSIQKDNNTNGKVNTHLLDFIEDNDRRKFDLSIQQLSISKEAYQFISLLKRQQSIDGDIFDPPPALIRGNIFNLNDPEENVVGYFHASDAYHISVVVDRRNLNVFERLENNNEAARCQRSF